MACKPCCKIRVRFWVGLMMFMCTFVGFLSKSIVLLSVEAIVAEKDDYMRVDSDDNHEPKNKELFTDTYGPNLTISDNYSKTLISTAFYQGILISSLISGFMVEKYGPSFIVYYAVTVQAAVTALTYAAVTFHWTAVFICFWISGFCTGFIEPAVIHLVARWSPLYERSKFTFCLLGEPLAIIWTLLFQFHTWKWNFYSISLIMVLFTTFWFFIVYNNPVAHKWVPREEQSKIAISQHETVLPYSTIPPYKNILTLRNFWLMVLAHMGSQWCYCVVTSVTPNFMAHEMGFEHDDRMFILFHGFRLLSGLFWAFIADYLRMYKSYVMTITAARRLFTFLSHIASGLFILSIILIRHNWKAIVSVLVISQTFSGAIVAGHLQVPLDLAPNYAATLFSFMNFFGYISWYLTIFTSTQVIAINHGMKGWHIIYGIAAIVTMVTGAPSVLFGTGNLKQWNTKKSNATNVKEEDEEKELAVRDLDTQHIAAKGSDKTNEKFRRSSSASQITVDHV